MDDNQAVNNQNNNQQDDNVQTQTPSLQAQTGSGLGEKEKEVVGSKEVIREVGKEIEPPKEVEETGVKLKKEEIKLPPPIEKLGVKPSAPAVPPPSSTVTLPLTDDQVMQGLASPIVSSLRWLAEFCLRQLKKAHISLKKVHGKIVRVRN